VNANSFVAGCWPRATLLRYAALGGLALTAALAVVWIGQIVAIAALGHLFFLCWELPLGYCLLMSLEPSE